MRNVQQRKTAKGILTCTKKKENKQKNRHKNLKYLIPWVSFIIGLCHVICVEFERFCIYYWVNEFYSQNDEIELQKATLLLFLKTEEDMLLLFV